MQLTVNWVSAAVLGVTRQGPLPASVGGTSSLTGVPNFCCAKAMVEYQKADAVPAHQIN